MKRIINGKEEKELEFFDGSIFPEIILNENVTINSDKIYISDKKIKEIYIPKITSNKHSPPSSPLDSPN